MKKFLLPLIVFLNVLYLLAQNVDTNTYPIPRPPPITGPTPSFLVRRTAPLAPTLYNGNAATLDNWILGGYGVVSNASERANIPIVFRKEMMLRGQASDTNIYMLERDLTTWTSLGNPKLWSTGGGGGGTNIYNADGTLLTNRFVYGDSKNLTFTNMNVISFYSDAVTLYANNGYSMFGGNTVTMNAGLELLNATPAGFLHIFPGTLLLQSNGTNDFRLVTPDVYAGTALPNQVLTLQSTNGSVRFSSPSSLVTTLYTGDGQLNGNRIVDGNSKSLTINNLTDFTVSGNSDSTSTFDGDVKINSNDANIRLKAFDQVLLQSRPENPGPSVSTEWNKLTIDATNQPLYIKTQGVRSNIALVDYVLTLINTNGLVDYRPTPAGGVNIYNSDGTATADRTYDGDGHFLHFQNISTIQLSAASGVQLNAANVDLSGSSNIRFNPSGDVTNQWVFENPSLLGSTNDAIVVKSGQYVRSSGMSIADIWAGGGSGGTNQNVMNSSLTATGSHTQDGNTNSLSWLNFSSFSITSTAGDYVQVAGGTATLADASGNSSITLDANEAQIVGIGTNGIRLHTPGVEAATVSNGYVYTLVNAANGKGEWTNAPASVNIYNSNGSFTGDRTVNASSHSLTVSSLTDHTESGSGNFDILFDTQLRLLANTTSVTVTPAKVELKATGSNSINLFSDKINTSTATVGQVWTLQNATTGKGEWANSTSPSGGNVDSVDTTADLISSSTPIVITKGYRTIGDQGHAAYRYVSGDSTATNTVTVFEGLSGRYFLMQSGAISAKQAGAYGDGSTDDYPFLSALFTACSGMTARLDSGFTFLSSQGFSQVDDLKVIARGATINVNLNGETGFKVGSRSTIDGGDWTFTRQSGGANGFDNSGFTFGYYVSAGSVSNSVLKNVKITLTSAVGHECSPVFITGGSHNISVENLEIVGSSTIDDAVTVHWGFVSPPETNGTLHPYDIHINNINVGNLTTSTADGGLVFCSAAYNVLAENIRGSRARHGCIAVVGDYGFKYSGFTTQTIGSVVYRNITCLRTDNIGALFQNLGVSSQVYPQEFVLENSSLFGPADGTDNGGLYAQTTRNLTVRNTIFAGHSTGTTFSGACLNTVLDRDTFATNSLAGINVDNSSLVGLDIIECSVYNNARSLSGTNAAGIKLANGSQVRVIGCKLGNTTSEPFQEVGLGVSSTMVNTTVAGNYVYNVKSGGLNVAYHLGSTANSNTHLWLVYDNQCLNTISLLSGPENIPYASRGKYRMFLGNGTPTLGTFIKGDRVTVNEATASPFEKVCSASGSPGTWITSY